MSQFSFKWKEMKRLSPSWKSENIILGFSLALEMAQWDVELNVGRFTTGYTLHPPCALNRQTNEKIPISWMFCDFFSQSILLSVGDGRNEKYYFHYEFFFRFFSEENMEQFFIWRLTFKSLTLSCGQRMWQAHAVKEFIIFSSPNTKTH